MRDGNTYRGARRNAARSAPTRFVTAWAYARSQTNEGWSPRAKSRYQAAQATGKRYPHSSTRQRARYARQSANV